MHQFSKSVYLHYDKDSEDEKIVVEVQDLSIPVILSQEFYELESSDEARSKTPKRRVSSLRVLERPAKEQMSSTGDQLFIQMSIRSDREPMENETLSIELKAVVIDNQEYMSMKTNAETQVCIIVNTTVKLLEQ
jgi:ABC-type uncharacterized transport system substrate-binding protein